MCGVETAAGARVCLVPAREACRSVRQVRIAVARAAAPDRCPASRPDRAVRVVARPSARATSAPSPRETTARPRRAASTPRTIAPTSTRRTAARARRRACDGSGARRRAHCALRAVCSGRARGTGRPKPFRAVRARDSPLWRCESKSRYPAGERGPRLRLHDEVEVVALHREGDHAEGVARRPAQRGPNDGEHRRRTQRRRQRRRAQGHVDGRVTRMRCPNAMRNTGATADRLATGAVTPTAVPANDELELCRARGHACASSPVRSEGDAPRHRGAAPIPEVRTARRVPEPPLPTPVTTPGCDRSARCAMRRRC